jgi:hypothetical protein
MNLIAIIVGTVIASLFITAGIWITWVRTRPKKETWNAAIYQLTNSTRESVVTKEGKILNKAVLKDLKPYHQDVLEKSLEKDGRVIYRLQKLNIATGAVTSDVVEYWGKGDNRVNIVLIDGQPFFLQKGYDKATGDYVVQPMPVSRTNMIESNLIIKKDRYRKNKDILEAITPWITIGLSMMGLVFAIFVLVQGLIEISENLESMADKFVHGEIRIEEIRQGINPNPVNVGRQPNPDATVTQMPVEGR